MIKIILSVLPFLVCAGWFCISLLRVSKSLPQHRVLTVFAAVCTLLYFCHACYFNQISNPNIESLWTLCSLSSYPLYLLYLLSIVTPKTMTWGRIHFFLPAMVVSLLRLTIGAPWVDRTRQLVFIVTVLFSCIVGLFRLVRFEKELNNLYADVDHRSSRPIQLLLVCFVFTSLLSAVFNVIGRKVFLSDTLLLAVPSLLFSTMLFLVFYIGFHYSFSLERMEAEIALPGEPIPVPDQQNHIGPELRRLMEDEQIFLRHDLKLSELASEVGTCRTYLSSYINNDLQMSFSDYINSHRISYARKLMADNPEMVLEDVALQAGFSSLTTFKRNLDKF